MPFDRPTLAELDNRLIADIESRLSGTDPRLRRSFLGTLVRGMAGGHHELFGFLEWIALQAFPDTAEDVELLQWANIWGVMPTAATRATGMLAVTGTTGTVVPSGTVWRSGVPVDYRSTAEVTIAAGAGVATVEAVEAGAAGNAVDGTKANLVSPINGVVSQAAASGAIEGGADIESTESVRLRLFQRIQNPPRGGTTEDYESWARSAAPADVTRSWGRPLARGLGTMDVYCMTDDATANGIPTATVVAAVQAYIDARRPVTADVDVIAPTPEALDIAINNVEPSTQAVMDAIEAELGDLIRRSSEPGGTILVSHIREAISTSAGETDHVLTAPVADVTVAAAEITVLGNVTFTVS